MKSSVIIASLIFMLGGCALSPQTIDIAPRLDTPASRPGNKSVSVVVNDTRTSRVIGTRGGIYRDTANITANQNMTQTLQAILANALRDMGYNVTDRGSVSLAVEVAELRYSATGEHTITDVETGATINATCRNGGLVANNSYRVTDRQEVLKAPTSGRNQELINNSLGTALQRMLNDTTLFDCINR